MPENKSSYINVNELKIGHYVYLDVGWMHHSFTFNSFQISTDTEIAEIRSLGIRQIRYDPDRSDVKQDSKSPVKINPEPILPGRSELEAAQKEEAQKKKQERITFAKKLRTKLIACEKEYMKAGAVVRDIMKNLFSSPAEAAASANQLVSNLADNLSAREDVAVYLMSGKGMAGKEVYFHSLSVATMGMMLARAMKLDEAAVHTIGMGGLFHDIGKTEIPDKILMKTEPLNNHEESLFQQHSKFGIKIAANLKLSEDIKTIIAQHHESLDGSGYPSGLKGNQISLGARVISVINSYDSHCNPHNPTDAVIPYKVLSSMFTKYKGRFDNDVLMTVVKILGVYPPGTIVKLSNNVIGMVVGINTKNSLRPQIMIYDAAIPVGEAISLDLEYEKDINIVSAINPTQLSKEEIAYLNPRKRVNYYVDTEQK